MEMLTIKWIKSGNKWERSWRPQGSRTILPTEVCAVPQAALITQLGKNPPAMQETPVQLLGREDPLEKG